MRDSNGNYLTAESFGFRVTATGKTLRKKQIFIVERTGEDVFIKTPMGRYLSFKADGKFNGDSEGKGADEVLKVEAQVDGRWAFKTARGYYIGGSGENLDAYTKVLGADRVWTMELAMHPQVCLMNFNRKRFVSVINNDFVCTSDVPWGGESMVMLVYNAATGLYALRAMNGLYLSDQGSAVSEGSAGAFILHFKDQLVAFQSVKTKKFLTAMGPTGNMRSTKDGKSSPDLVVSHDELWVIQDSEPQFKLKSASKLQFCSGKTGLEVTANQSSAGFNEFFQFEINPANKQWSLRNNKGKFWSVQADGSVHATCPPEKRGATEFFSAEWRGPRLSLKASNGNYISVKPNGALVATGNAVNDDSMFIYEIINRPMLILRGEYGFVSMLQSGFLESNSSSPTPFKLHVSAGECLISGMNDKFWSVKVPGISVTGDNPEKYTMEFVEHSKVAIKAVANGKYLQGAQNGGFTATGSNIDASTLWEY